MNLTNLQLLNDNGEQISVYRVVTSDTIPDGPALDEHPDRDCVYPNANLSFVPDAEGVVHYYVRRGPSPEREGEGELAKRSFTVTPDDVGKELTIYGVVRYDYDLSATPEYELLVEFGGTWVMFAPIVMR